MPVSQIEAKIGYSFDNAKLIATALTHSSYANERRSGSSESNERLEFLGDSVLGMLTAGRLYSSYPDMPEGQMTRLRAELVCEMNLARAAHELELGGFLRLGRGEERMGGRDRQSILADAVEAVLAAIYLDGGMEPAQRFVDRYILSPLEESGEAFTSDYKTALQEYMQARGGQSPDYEIISEEGPDHLKVFKAAVLRGGVTLGMGDGRSKKEAEQSAAQAALSTLRRQ